ncbi:recombinase family protein [Paenibacillus sp. GCM10027626]|uniref:recombinase family protein n=1 Tax=Paenibacillus sp. GCM10027626 TaxID=3273411 RepID=UPI00363CB536
MRTHTRKYGYARVSSKDQNEDRQLTVLREQGIPEEYIFVDKISGKNFDRPEYQLLKRVLREGDTVFVKSINRFGRNKREISKQWQWLIDQRWQNNELSAVEFMKKLGLKKNTFYKIMKEYEQVAAATNS